MSAKRFNLEWRLAPKHAGKHSLSSDCEWTVIVGKQRKRKNGRKSVPTLQLSEALADRLLDKWTKTPNAHLMEFRKVEVPERKTA